MSPDRRWATVARGLQPFFLFIDDRTEAVVFSYKIVGIHDPLSFPRPQTRMRKKIRITTRRWKRPAALPGAAVRSFPNDLRAETGCQRNPSPPLALSLSARRDGAPIEHFRAAAPPEPAEAKPRFSPNSVRLTRSAVRRYISARKKGKKRWFKFPIHNEVEHHLASRPERRCVLYREGLVS